MCGPKSKVSYAEENFEEDDELPCLARIKYLLEINWEAVRTRDDTGIRMLPIHVAARSGIPLVLYAYKLWYMPGPRG